MLVEFVTTGKFNFKDFASSVIKDIARIVIQSQITKLAQWARGALGNFFSGGGGGAGGSFTNADGSTNWGGIASNLGTLGQFGYAAYTGSGSGLAGTAGAWVGNTLGFSQTAIGANAAVAGHIGETAYAGTIYAIIAPPV